MKIAGIIAEYNPFHEGHLYHIRETRARTECDFIVCVMSGAFTQRGEPALMDKFARAECALRAGADAVFELPAVCAVRPAQFFARGGVAILRALGADYLSFGCETDDLALLWTLSDMLSNESGEMSSAIREGLDAGKSFARARGEALARESGLPANALCQPNLSLALEYLQGLRGLPSAMLPVAILRTAPYHASPANAAAAPHASAEAIRAAIYAGNARGALSLVPACARSILSRALDGGVSMPGALDNLALYSLRGMSASRAEALPDAGEGLGLRILKMARESASVEELIAKVKCKRYTRARIARAVAAALLDLPRLAPETPPYLRLLGFRKDASGLLGELAARSGGKVASDPSLIECEPAFIAETRATDLWGLTVKKKEYRVCGRDRTEKFLVV